ncbi:antibiotic biosynthesis monooxygenase [Levilactobacillus zymae]|uniref:antibiotic biosynthesis monooxygenase n=1 Tax=Levilactobacillus zymae TaxID=267363 RepID=UPI003FCDB566
MVQNIALTFGSKAILTQFMTANSDRKLVLLGSSTGDDEGLQLLDVSGQPSLFTTNLDYRVKLHQGATDWRGFFSFSYFKFDPDTADVFDAKINRLAANPLPEGMRALYVLTKTADSGSYILLTIWDDGQAFSLWRHSAAFAPLDIYATSANHYHAAGYHRLAAKTTH